MSSYLVRGKNSMKKSVSLLATLLIITGCANSTYAIPKQQVNRPNKLFNETSLKKGDAKYVESLQEFAVDFYQALGKEKNEIFSPLSIATCFSMLYDGANGETKSELGALLHYDESFNHLEEIQNMLLNCAIKSSDKKTYLDVSQSLWSRGTGTYKENFIKNMTDYYYSELFEGVDLDKEGGKLVSDWINHKTNNFLETKPEDFKYNVNSEFVLLNTIYLKSPWDIKDLFEEKNNTERTFYGKDSDVTKPFMKGSVSNSSFYRKDEYRIASLDYKSGIKFNILLPDKGSNYTEVLNNEEALKRLLNTNDKSDYTDAEVSWTLPKFKIKRDYDLMVELPKLGLSTEVFDNPNLSTMTDMENLFIESADHVAGIEVDNEGVKAAAYTHVGVGTKAAPPKQVEQFVIDHPFAYSITSKEGYPLFMGTINQL